MTGDIAIQSGHSGPDDSRLMATVTCDKCGCEFQIYHAILYADSARAKKEATYIKADVLHGEHIDPKFVNHLDEYDLDDAEQFM
jgi:hypothetical protein